MTPEENALLQRHRAEAMRLKHRIEDFWRRARVGLPDVKLVQVGNRERARFDIRSDLVNGLPPEARERRP